MIRTFFGKPIPFMGEQYFPDKMTAEEFAKSISKDVLSFKTNMNNFKPEKGKTKYPEQWMETFLHWLDLTEDKKYYGN
jgi:hypothetical protein